MSRTTSMSTSTGSRMKTNYSGMSPQQREKQLHIGKRKKWRRDPDLFLAFFFFIIATPSMLVVLYFRLSSFTLQVENRDGLTDTSILRDFSERHFAGTFSVRKAAGGMRLVSCENELSMSEVVGPCYCSPWSFDSDDWWIRNPLYQLAGKDNDTHTCFRKISDPEHLSFVQSLHSLQWGLHHPLVPNQSAVSSTLSLDSHCKDSIQMPQVSSGYAAALMSVSRSFYASWDQYHRPFQITKHREGANWNFATRNVSHWSYCSSQDMNCYFLPIGNCPAEIGRDDGIRGIKPTKHRDKERFGWLRQYAFRPRHIVRYRLRRYLKRNFPDFFGNNRELSFQCDAVLHVRRGDISFGRGRRYAAVHEYLVAGQVPRNGTVVILTDDQSTIDEINTYLKDSWKFVYIDRPRFRGSEGGFEGFIPSADPAHEVLTIMAELELAQSCAKIVHGKSGFVDIIKESMENYGHKTGQGFESIYLQTQLSKADQPKVDPRNRTESYLKSIQEYYSNLDHNF